MNVAMDRKRCPNSTSFPSPEDSYEDTSKIPHITTAQPKRRTARIIRRTEPTVDVNKPLIQFTDKNHTPKEPIGYDTVETASYSNLHCFYTHNDDISDLHNICGWRNDDHSKLDKEFLTSRYGITTLATRGLLQSRELSSRLYPSRLSSRLTRKREQYCFQHFDDIEDHIRKYNQFCSFTQVLSPSTARRNSTVNKHKDDHQLQDLSFPQENNEYSYHLTSAAPETALNNQITDLSLLQNLATRLGIGESINEPQLLQSPYRTTPASISNQRDESIDNLIVCPPATKIQKSNSSTSGKNSSRQASHQQTRHFPSLTRPVQPKQRSHSTISVTKYLQVNKNRNSTTDEKEQQHIKDTNGNKEEEGQLEFADHSSSASYLSSKNSSTHCIENNDDAKNTLEMKPTLSNKDHNKEQLIQRKANSLGLLSHRWARNFIERGFMNEHLPRKFYYEISRPVTRDTSRSTNKKPQTQEDNGIFSHIQNRSAKVSLNQTSKEKKQKLKQLENVYGRKQSEITCNNARTSTHRSNTNKTSASRPVTRQNLSRKDKSRGHGESKKHSTPVRHWQIKGEKWQVGDTFEALNRLTIN